jgi:hypothetical protein
VFYGWACCHTQYIDLFLRGRGRGREFIVDGQLTVFMIELLATEMHYTLVIRGLSYLYKARYLRKLYEI